MKINVSKMSEAQWLETRESLGIGASEMGAVLGLDTYCPKFKLWARKTGIDKTPFEPNGFTESGKYFESYVANIFQYWEPKQTESEFWQAVHNKDKKRKIVKTNYIHVSDEAPHLFASPDRFVYEEDKGWGCLEVKTTVSWGMREHEMEIKLATICQLQQQLYCVNTDNSAGRKCSFGYVVIYEADTRKMPRVFRFDYDKNTVEKVIAAGTEFWDNVLETKMGIITKQNFDDLKPESESTSAYLEYIKEQTKTKSETELSYMIGDEESYLDGLEINKLKEQMKELKTSCEAIEAKIKSKMTYTDYMVDGDTNEEIPVIRRKNIMQFEEDPESSIVWKQNKAGADMFQIKIK